MKEPEAPSTTPEQTPALAPHPESIAYRPTATPETATQVSGMNADPWLRFFARLVDIQIWSLVVAFIAGLFLPWLFANGSFLTGQLGSRVLGWIIIPFALALDAFAYSLFGNTPGKWIAGIKVRSLEGDKVSFATYLKRNFGMYWFGLGLDIPIIVLVTMWKNYGIAEGDEIVRWDESTGTRTFVKGASTLRLVAIGAIWFLAYVWQIIETVRP